MATAPMLKQDTASIWINRMNLTGTVDVVAGDKTVVIFHADQDCVLHFKNPKVFDREYLPLKKDMLNTQLLMSKSEKTEFEVLVPIAIDPMGARTPWPIVPKD